MTAGDAATLQIAFLAHYDTTYMILDRFGGSRDHLRSPKPKFSILHRIFLWKSIEISYRVLVELLVFVFKPQFLCSSSGEVGVGGLIISPEIMFIHPISLF